jgi:hypothetical protein
MSEQASYPRFENDLDRLKRSHSAFVKAAPRIAEILGKRPADWTPADFRVVTAAGSLHTAIERLLTALEPEQAN